MPAKVTIQFVVPVGYQQGDYAQLHGNGGSGDIDWNNPLDDNNYELFPRGAGIFGFGHAPFGHFRFGKGHSMRAAGFGHLPFGHFPFGYGTAAIEAANEVDSCGVDYKYSLACYDSLGNLHVGSPEEETVTVHIAPLAPTGLVINSYNKDTDVLTLDAA